MLQTMPTMQNWANNQITVKKKRAINFCNHLVTSHSHCLHYKALKYQEKNLKKSSLSQLAPCLRSLTSSIQNFRTDPKPFGPTKL